MPHRVEFSRIGSTEQPLLIAGIAFIAGMTLAGSVGFRPGVLILVSVVAWTAIGIGILRECKGVMLLVVTEFAVLGATLASLDEAGIERTRLRRQIENRVLRENEPVQLLGVLAGAPELAPDRIYLEIEAQRIHDHQVERPASGRVRLLVAFDDPDKRHDFDVLHLDYGSKVQVSCSLRRPPGFQNPGSPSLRSILNQQGIDAIGSLKEPLLIEPLEITASSRGLRELYGLRSTAITVLMRGLHQPTSGLLVASLLGNHRFLDRRIAESFRSGGTYHLLVISGLHVSLIATLLIGVLRRLVCSAATRFVATATVLWCFAIMVGAQPAVTRAAAMLSIVLFGGMIFRKQAAANSLGFAAVALLAWQPRDLLNPGFHLSFLTVLAMALATIPLYERLRRIGQWKPSEATPYPPSCSRPLRSFAEAMFWDEHAHRREMADSRIRFGLEKTVIVRWLMAFHLTWLAWIARASFATLLTTVGIQLSLLPIMIIYFHRVSLVAPLSNVVEAALLFLLMVVGCLYIGVYWIDVGVASALAPAVNAAGEVAVALSHRFDRLPRGSFRVPDYGDLSILIYGTYLAIAFAWVLLISRWNPLAPRSGTRGSPTRRLGVAALAVLSMTLVLVVSTHPFKPRFDEGRLTLTLLDVGQGDSMAIIFPKGRLMLLDSGGKVVFREPQRDAIDEGFVEDRAGIGELAIAPFLWRLGVKRIDIVGATHSDADHVQGFADLVPAFAIGEAIAGPSVATSDVPFPPALRAKGVYTRELIRGDRLEVDGVTIDVLAPFSELGSPRYSANDRSLVLRLRFGDRQLLLTGDIERRTESLLLRSGDDLRADVLKVAHHGSRTSSSREFLSRVQPRLALISAGSPSPFGHPHKDVLARLAEAGARVLQTGACGAITVSTDGRDLRCQTFVKCE